MEESILPPSYVPQHAMNSFYLTRLYKSHGTGHCVEAYANMPAPMPNVKIDFKIVFSEWALTF